MANLKSVVFLAFLLSASLYSYWASNRDYHWIVPHISDRAPAAIRSDSQVQSLLEKPMRVYKQEFVLNSIDIREREGKTFFSMGPFSVGDNFVCLEYPHVRLKFTADGASVSGRKATILVQTPCRLQKDNPEVISETPLPFGQWERWPAQLEIQEQWKDQPVKYRLEPINEDWPAQWNLESIEFYKDETLESERVVFNNHQFLRHFGEPLSVR